jgi:hypothetical protein
MPQIVLLRRKTKQNTKDNFACLLVSSFKFGMNYVSFWVKVNDGNNSTSHVSTYDYKHLRTCLGNVHTLNNMAFFRTFPILIIHPYSCASSIFHYRSLSQEALVYSMSILQLSITTSKHRRG